MKNIKKSILFICTFILMIIISNKVYAASTTLTASNYNVTTGTTVNITVGVQSAEVWKLDLKSSGGTLSGQTSGIIDAPGSEVTQTVANATFVASTPGDYTITLTGNVASTEDVSNNIKQTVNKSITIKVTSPQPTPTPTPTPTPIPTPAPTFSSVSETVYTTSQVTFRSSYSTSSSSLGTIPQGTALTRIGVSSTKVSGYYWSKVTYNGKTGYVASTFLTTTKPEEPTAAPSTQPSAPPVEQKSSDSSLKSLSIEGIEITPEFDTNITTYMANLKKDVTEVEVIVELNDEKAKYEIVGNTNLQYGENVIIVTVTAEDGTVTNYEINLTKETPEIPLNVFQIVGIKENGEKVNITLDNPTITDDIVSYTLKLSEYMKAIDIQSLLSSETNQYEGIGIFNLEIGENNFTVILKQEDEGSKVIEYRITINNPEKIVEVNQTNNEINYKVIAIIAIIAIVAIIGIIFLIVHYKKQNNIEYGKTDYSFLSEELDKKENTEENKVENQQKRKGGKHF